MQPVVGEVEPLCVVEVGQHVVVVIAEQERRRDRTVAQRHQRLDDPAAVGAPVDVVAEEDELRRRVRAGAEVGAYSCDQRRQQVQPPMDVADDVKPLAFGQVAHGWRRGGRVGRRPPSSACAPGRPVPSTR